MTAQVNDEIRFGKLVTKTVFLRGGSGPIDHDEVALPARRDPQRALQPERQNAVHWHLDGATLG